MALLSGPSKTMDQTRENQAAGKIDVRPTRLRAGIRTKVAPRPVKYRG
jgi:hypothetical protein